MGDLRKALDVQHFHAGIGEGFPEQELRLGTEAGVHFLVRGLVVHERHLDAHLLQGDAQQVEGSAVDVVQAHDMVPRPADVQAGEQVRRLAGRGQDRAHTAFQGGDPGRDGIVGGILEPGIEITAVLQVEEPAHLVGSLVFESRALDDGNLSWITLSGLVTGLHAKRTDAGSLLLFSH